MTKKQLLILYGAGGHGKVAAEIAALTGYDPSFFLDDNPKCTEVLGVPVKTPDAIQWRDMGSFAFHVSIGSNSARKKAFQFLMKMGGTPLTLIHPKACISSHAIVGRGALVAANATINPCANIGENTIINTGSLVDHDCRIGNHTHIAPGARLAGEVSVGDESLIGVGACFRPLITVGRNSVVGVGSVVVRHVPDNVVVCGNPARILNSKKP